jgi:hypothetical protein
MIEPTQKYLHQLIEIKAFIDFNKGKAIALSKILRTKFKYASTEASALIQTGIVEKVHTGGKGATYFYNWMAEEPSLEVLQILISGRRNLYKKQAISRNKREMLKLAEEGSPVIEKIRIDTERIGEFLKSLTPAERIYLAHSRNISDSIQKLIKDFELMKILLPEIGTMILKTWQS